MNRRALLASGIILAGGGLAGCLGRGASGMEGDVPEPVDLSGGKYDDHGGMVIGRHGGANGQVFYAENAPDRGENPAWFHTLVFGLFPYHFGRLDRGWEPRVVYVTDFSQVEYELTERDGRLQMPAPTAAETFGEAAGLTYVAESEVMGGMGPALHPFSDEADAEAFAAEHDGIALSFEEIDPVIVERLQRGSGHGHDHDE
ncbi:MAG: nitrous oxide reductase accessory protein NosL [Natronomonas sp.]|uniref:nitrous oxide reductase accessory protein NosL n=1 Tax=Natronomonas sp. TaxID=2184060 RepID=UPI0028707192|nr:nitrous oxide reductase accessory protein NosL [Natronomonas sp.]MDR9381650.1 nitrous oxide reductase accessory protein NosL [Natronomonas sp.]MDR9431236.1 nitrous oxide reductase accessory protein NosL [Natronomonas sp.]